MTWIPDGTSIAAFRENPERFRLRHRKHLVSKGRQEAPTSGIAFHAALKEWFASPTSDIEQALTALRTAWGDEPAFHTGLKRPLSLFERIMRGYAERWPRESDPFEVVRNEGVVEAVIKVGWGGGGEPAHPLDKIAFTYWGILDRVVRFADGSTYVMDTKTTSAWLSEAYFEQFRLSPQLMGYCALELVNGRLCDGFYIDAVHVDPFQTRQRTDAKGKLTISESGGTVKPADFWRHGPTKIAQWELSRWAQDMEHTLLVIEDLDRERGPDVPWPVWSNSKFNQPDEYHRAFYVQPPELHEQNASEFEVSAWLKPS